MTIAFISAIIFMRVVQSVFNKKAALLIPEGLTAYITYIMITKLFAAVFAAVSLPAGGGLSGFNLQAFLIASASGTFLALSSFFGIKALLQGTMALSSVFSSAGLILPCVLGVYFFNEPITPLQAVCIAGVIVSAILLIGSTKKLISGFSSKTILYLIGSLISNGMVMFCQKLFGVLQPDGNVSLFSMMTFLIPAVVLALIIPFVGKREKSKEKFPKKLILYATYLAFAVFIIQQFVTLLTPRLSSAILFTVVNGSATVISAIVGAAMYKEKITLQSAAGVALGVISMILIKSA